MWWLWWLASCWRSRISMLQGNTRSYREIYVRRNECCMYFKPPWLRSTNKPNSSAASWTFTTRQEWETLQKVWPYRKSVSAWFFNIQYKTIWYILMFSRLYTAHHYHLFPDRFLRAVAYRWLARWLFGEMGWENTRPLCACIYHHIRKTFPTSNTTGYTSGQERASDH